MKIFLTKTGLLVVREDCAFFTDNNGSFRRLSTNDEVSYLVNEVGLPKVTLSQSDLKKKLAAMQPILWHYMWTTVHTDYRGWKPEGLDNHAYYRYKHFFIRLKEEFEIRCFELCGTSSGLPFDELGNWFEEKANLNKVRIIGVKFPIEGENAPNEVIETKWATGEIVVDQYLRERRYSLAAASIVQNYKTSSDGAEIYEPLTEKEKERRKNIAFELMEKLKNEKKYRLESGFAY